MFSLYLVLYLSVFQTTRKFATKNRHNAVTVHLGCVGSLRFGEILLSTGVLRGALPVSAITSPIHSFIQVVCLTTGPKPLPKRALHIVRSRAFFFKWEYPLLSLRSSSSFLRLLSRLPVTSIPPFIFPSITRCRRQFLCKMTSPMPPKKHVSQNLVIYSQ